MDESNISEGQITTSGNFVLVKKIKCLNEFWSYINSNNVIFARHRMYPSAFFYSWSIRLISTWIKNGFFWIAEPTKNNKSLAAAFGRSLRIGGNDGQAMSKLGVPIAAATTLNNLKN